MKEEYMKSSHFKKKIENFKLNKIMGRIKPHAKGPNPLSVKKKRVKRNHSGEYKDEIKQEDNQDTKILNEDNMGDPKKRERKRFKKVKINKINN